MLLLESNQLCGGNSSIAFGVIDYLLEEHTYHCL